MDLGKPFWLFTFQRNDLYLNDTFVNNLGILDIDIDDEDAEKFKLFWQISHVERT